MQKEMHAAAQAAGPAQAQAMTTATAAGVPFMLILQWFFKYGPDIASKIQELIDAWKAQGSPK